MSGNNKIRALVAEDDYLVGEMVQGLLHDLGYQVLGVATNGLQAVKMTYDLSPDVVIMDIRMADMDGITAAAEIQRSHPTPVVILSAYETPDLVRAASAAGAGFYLVKPPSPRELERAITIAIARHNDLLELQRLNQQLNEFNADLNAFAHTVAHELYNAINLVVGYTDLLLTELGHASQEHMAGRLAVVAQSGRKMNQIVDNLVQLSRVREEAIETHPVNMGAAVQQALEALEIKIVETQAEITLPDEWPTAVGYAPWVEEIWINYLSNALKYGGERPCIQLGYDTLPDGYFRFWARDNGNGISAEDQSRIFAPFTRLAQETTSCGFGLGLSIVQRIASRLDGAVGVESEPGNGALFWFTLPAASFTL